MSPRLAPLLRGVRSPRTPLIAATMLALMVALLALPKVLDHDRAQPTAGNPITPGVYTGLGFDQCQAPRQSSMDTWLAKSPFRAVGIYVTGNERGCRTQTYLTPTWVATQLAKGWHLLPIDFGPQASCNGRFPRYKGDVTINPSSTKGYAAAIAQGTAEATKGIAEAKAIGIVPGSTLFYDLEGFTYTNTACRESALRFVSAWSARVKALGYRAGFYSSAGSGIKMVEAARVAHTAGITLPDVLWLARYDGKANTSATDYISDAGWQGNRVKQFQGGHNETYGGVTINIDRNYLKLTTPTAAPKPAVAKPTATSKSTAASSASVAVAPEKHCTFVSGGVKVDLSTYQQLRRPTSTFTPRAAAVRALTCLLRERTKYRGPVGPTYSAKVQAFVRLWRTQHHLAANARWTTTQWMWLLAKGPKVTLTAKSTGTRVRDLQRALNASAPTVRLAVTGSFDSRTLAAVKAWRKRAGVSRGDFGPVQWKALAAGRR
ncbi:glycoside hydrolase domain-containing protein [Nocardioides sp. Kera G14]|uniref:glycoside hydrolase domain-containing protein n=1 Tax=Nocardioides sp. Kera G14 TaxID=2884264 RepID=UPI001D111964|nr:glycoside hydrolase domain-containing protein [Nocardioides sp. Kera G14]UDY23163.1 DUF1906 domain-containing protein [Nocardioides sp. Kera G14]